MSRNIVEQIQSEEDRSIIEAIEATISMDNISKELVLDIRKGELINHIAKFLVLKKHVVQKSILNKKDKDTTDIFLSNGEILERMYVEKLMGNKELNVCDLTEEDHKELSAMTNYNNEVEDARLLFEILTKNDKSGLLRVFESEDHREYKKLQKEEFNNETLEDSIDIDDVLPL